MDDVKVVIEAAEMTRVLNQLKKFDPALSMTLRRRIRNAGRLVMADAQDAIRQFPVHRSDRGVREALAKSLAVRVNTTPASKSQGVIIVSTGRLLPEKKKALVKAFNKFELHHPVFGHGKWVTQPGIRYFGQRIISKHEMQAVAEIRAALDEAVEAMR